MPRPREFDESVALRAIRNAFWARGYAATSIDDLVRATGLGKGSLYGAFGSKREMFVRALTVYCESALAFAATALHGGDRDALERLHGYVGKMVTAIAHAKHGCLLAKAIAELAGDDAEIDGLVSGFFLRYAEVLADTIRQARRAGSLAGDDEPAEQANVLVAVLRGLESMGKGGVSAATLQDIAARALAALR